ncbi:MAG: hypothetical protein PHY72_00060 [Candidatus Pacebacteria bacterium]|nr:hypothetical protein [Candidatus Paceibacterota bacterium]
MNRSAIENNPRDKFKKPVYWLVVLAFICCLVNWHDLPGIWKDNMERVQKESFFTAKEVDEAWRVYDEVSTKAEKMGKEYSPKNFFQDRNVLVPLKYKFQKAISFEGKSDYPNRNVIALSEMMEGLLTCLHQQAEDNFPRYYPDSVKISREEESRNLRIWYEAEIEAPIPAGCEPIHISGWALLGLCGWIAISYLKFLSFALFLILFQLWRKKQSILQELVLRPKNLFFSILEGPIGIIAYADIESVTEWQCAKLSATYMRQQGRWYLTDEEKKNLWVEACRETNINPEMIVKRSKLAIASGYLLVMLPIPFMALFAVGFQQKPVGQISTQAIHGQQDQDKGKEQKEPSQLFICVILSRKVKLPDYFEPVAGISTEVLPILTAERIWFLPPSLAPPLSRR